MIKVSTAVWKQEFDLENTAIFHKIKNVPHVLMYFFWTGLFPRVFTVCKYLEKEIVSFLKPKRSTDKIQPLVENILRSVHPLTDEVDDKLMVGGEQRWMIRSWWQHTNCKNLLYRVKGWCYFRDWVNT